MTKPSDEKNRKALTARAAPSAYAVGYGKPPEHSRFKPGQSGNPRGRPRGSKNRRPPSNPGEERMKEIVLGEAYRTIKVNDGAGQVSVPMAQAIIRSLAFNAAKGNQRAQRLFTELLATTERENKRAHDEWLEVAITYKVDWERELARREQLGITGPEPLPHPDHVLVDLRNNSVRIVGPATREEKAEWEMWMKRKAECETEIAELRQLLDQPDYPYRKQVEEDIEHEKKILAIVNRVIAFI